MKISTWLFATILTAASLAAVGRGVAGEWQDPLAGQTLFFSQSERQGMQNRLQRDDDVSSMAHDSATRRTGPVDARLSGQRVQAPLFQGMLAVNGETTIWVDDRSVPAETLLNGIGRMRLVDQVLSHTSEGQWRTGRVLPGQRIR